MRLTATAMIFLISMMTISLTGLSNASAGEICIQRHAAEDCLRKAERFDDLAAEARAIRVQRDECAGRLGEARDGVEDCRESVRALEGEVVRLENRTPRRWYFAGGAGVVSVGVTVAVVLFR